jgi:hypothetical protein
VRAAHRALKDVEDLVISVDDARRLGVRQLDALLDQAQDLADRAERLRHAIDSARLELEIAD